MKKTISVLLVLVVAILSLPSLVFAEDFQLRNGILFGDSIEKVKEKETLPFDSVSDDKTEYKFKGTIAGMEGTVQYFFDAKAKILTDMLYRFSPVSNKDIVDSNYSKLKESLIKKYGSPLNNENGKIFAIMGKALDESASVITLFEFLNGSGDYRDNDEWIVNCDNYSVKIDLISFYGYSPNSGYNFYNYISYHFFTDYDLSQALQKQESEVAAIDNDL